MYQTTVGTHHHRSFAVRPDFVELLPQYLIAAGYRTTQINTDLNTSIHPDEWAQYLDNDALLDGTDDKPFFAVYSFHESHASTFKMTPEEVRYQRSNLLQSEELHDPRKAPLPSFVPDTPLARERTALFYDALTQVDYHVSEVMDKLQAHGLHNNTIVFFWSDHGTGFPRGKTHVYEDGLRVPLIVHFPEKYQYFAPGPPGTVVDDLVMTMDMGASVLSMAEVPIPAHFQGQAFLGPQKAEYRCYVPGARDRLDNCNEMIRTVRNGKYRYIRNFLPHRPYASFYPDGGFFNEIPPEGTPEHAFWDTSCLPCQLLTLHSRFHGNLEEAELYSDPLYLPGAWVPHCAITMEEPLPRTLDTIRTTHAKSVLGEYCISRVDVVEFRPVTSLATFELIDRNAEPDAPGNIG